MTLVHRPAPVVFLAGLAGSLAVFAGAAHAQEMPDVTVGDVSVVDVSKARTWVVKITANAAVGPAYWGASGFGGYGYPSLSFRRADQPEDFESPDDGFSWALIGHDTWKAGILGQYMTGRYNSQHGLEGTESVPWGINLGGFAEFWPVPWLRTRVDVLHGVKGNFGWSSNIGADYVRPWNKFTFALGPRMTLGDAKYTDTYFGVSDTAPAVNPKLKAYSPGGGINTVGAMGSVDYEWNQHWSTVTYVRYDRLTGSAYDSPIVQNVGSPNQVTAGLRVSYSFGVNWGQGQ